MAFSLSACVCVCRRFHGVVVLGFYYPPPATRACPPPCTSVAHFCAYVFVCVRFPLSFLFFQTSSSYVLPEEQQKRLGQVEIALAPEELEQLDGQALKRKYEQQLEEEKRCTLAKQQGGGYCDDDDEDGHAHKKKKVDKDGKRKLNIF